MRRFKETFLRLLIMHDHFALGELYGDYSWYPKLFLQMDAPVTVFSETRTYYDPFPMVTGELPHLYSEWEFWAYGKIRYKPKPRLDEDEALKHFLGLNKKEFAHLFIPTMQSKDYGGMELSINATPEQVANNIKIFLDLVLLKHGKKMPVRKM